MVDNKTRILDGCMNLKLGFEAGIVKNRARTVRFYVYK